MDTSIDPTCPECGQATHTMEHSLLNCSVFNTSWNWHFRRHDLSPEILRNLHLLRRSLQVTNAKGQWSELSFYVCSWNGQGTNASPTFAKYWPLSKLLKQFFYTLVLIWKSAAKCAHWFSVYNCTILTIMTRDGLTELEAQSHGTQYTESIPGRQRQVYWLTPSTHVAPFIHGLLAQSSTFTAHVGPE